MVQPSQTSAGDARRAMKDGPGFVSLTTDYGHSDGFVAVLHGVILRICPTARIIDVTHDIDPGDVARGAAVLAQTVPHLPTGVHVAVVDPGVGTARRGVALRTPGGFLVGPDNGLLPDAAEALGGIEAAVVLTNPGWHATTVTSTFHGRDIFAPVAARLLAGRDFSGAGEPIDVTSLITLPASEPLISPGQVRARVRMVDRFGNVQLAAPASTLANLATHVTVNERSATRANTFGDVPAGALVVFADSAGYAAVAVNGGRAATALAAVPGDTIVIEDCQRVSPSPASGTSAR